MLRILLLVYLFSAANGLLMVALDRALGFAAPGKQPAAPARSGARASALS